MRSFSKVVISIFFLSLFCFTLATEVAKEKMPSGVGPGKAIVEANKKDGLRFSEIALKNLEVITSPISASAPLKLPLTSLIYSQSEVGVYRLRSGWFKYIEVKIISKIAKEAIVQSSELVSKDQIAIQGGDLLKLADLNVWSGDDGGE